MDEKTLPKCALCDLDLVEATVTLEYLGHSFTVELPQCPKCGQVLITEELVRGRMKKAEILLEDK